MTDTIEGLLARAADRLAEAKARISALEKTSASELSKLGERLAEVESKFESRGVLVGQLLKERDECRAAAAEAALKAADRIAELEGRLVGRYYDRMFGATAGPLIEHDWRPYEGWFVCMRCGLIRGDKTPLVCRGSLPAVELREPEAAAVVKPHVTAEIHAGRLVVFGRPDPSDETHNCDALGCGSAGPHVLEYLSPTEAAQELYRLRARVAYIEAPPVVPDGWRVKQDNNGRWKLWLVYKESDNTPDSPCARLDRQSWVHSLDGESLVAPWAALAALEYAHRTGQSPPHEGNEETTP